MDNNNLNIFQDDDYSDEDMQEDQSHDSQDYTLDPHEDIPQNLKSSQIYIGDNIPKPQVTDSPPQKKGLKLIADEAQQSKDQIMKQVSQVELKLKPHERKIGQYILGKTIGEGTFGKVKIGMHILTQAKVAVKILEKSKIIDVADVERVSREIHILKIVQHPQVVQLYEIIETQKKLYLIMEYASGGELFDYIVKHQRVQEKEACKFFQQLLSGIEYISRLNIVHRDLKPENLLLDFDKGIKIVDFGLSNTYKTGELLKTACGSPCYAAPEMIAGKKYNGTNVDIWSCGVILFALICGYLPFEDPNTSNLYKKILSADFQTPNYVSDEAKDLFHCILNTDPEKRYTIEQIRKHPWFNLVPCESNFKGIKVGIDPVPIDVAILERMKTDYGIDINYAKMCIQANKHNHISASYYLLLKEIIKKGEKSIADVRSPDYNPQLFIHTAQVVKSDKAAPAVEREDMKLVRNETEKNVGQAGAANQRGRRGSKLTVDQNNSQERTKSNQPQMLRKIADGLLEFERYADRKKRLQSISQKKQNEDRVKNMNMQLSLNQIPEDMLSNNGALALLQRGLSPVAAPGHETISYEQLDPNLIYGNYRDNSPSLSPHSIRVNAQKGKMSTQFGNFLYQVDAKQFPNSKAPNPQENHQLDQYQLSALKNQLHMQALQASNLPPGININGQMNAKQLKQLYMYQKNTNKKLTNHEIMLKNMVQVGADETQLSKIQLLQQNYSKQPIKKQKGQNFSSIQTAYDTLQNQTLTGKGKKQQQYLGMTTMQQASSNGSQRQKIGMHNRFATTQFNPNPVFHTLVPGGTSNGGNVMINPDGSGQVFTNTSIPKYSTHSNFFAAQTGSRLGAQSNLQQKSKRVKNQTVTGSGSLGPGGGIFSPKNAPTNSFGFGFQNSLFPSSVNTPQGMLQNQGQMFTIDTQQNFSNKLMNSLQPGQNPKNGTLTASLTVSQKQNSMPTKNALGQKKRGSSITNSHNMQMLQQNNNTISYGPNQPRLQDIQSENSNQALFKRRRDHSKGAQKVAKSAQKYGTIQQNERGLANVSSQRNQISKNNLSVNKPPLVDDKNRSAQVSQKKNRGKNQPLTIQSSLHNEALNINLNTTGAVSTKNQNLFSPVGGSSAAQRRVQATMENSAQQLQYQQQQEHINNLNRIQYQLQLKKQQRANLMAGQLDVANPSTQSYLRLQQNSLDLSPQNKKTLNSSLLAQNYAPHLLLQNYHGNGYPQAQQQSSIKTTQSRRKTPQNQNQKQQGPSPLNWQQNTKNQFGATSVLQPMPLDSSNIDYQEDVMDISNNTIANINSQLGGPTQTLQGRKKSRTKKKS